MEMQIRNIQFQQRSREYVSGEAEAGCRLHYIVGGRGRLTCASGRYPLRSGALVVLRNGEKYRMDSSRRGSFISQYIIMADGLELSQLPGMSAHLRIFDAGSAERSFFEQLRLDHDSGNGLLRDAARYRLLSFLLVLAGRGSADPAGGGRDHIESALRLMQENVRRRMNLDAIAAEVGLNKSYLVRLFKEHIGQAPMRYFNELKINAACHLLQDTDMAVAQISAHLGFAEEFYFSRSFKKFKGVSPVGYRRLADGETARLSA